MGLVASLITSRVYLLKSVAIFLVFGLMATAAGVADPADAEDSSSSEILDKYLANTESQEYSLRGLQMDIDIDAALPKLQKSGRLHALRSISKLGQITYGGLRFIGDNTIKNDVIVRYLTAEKQSQGISQMALTPKNYKFKYKGVMDRNGYTVHVFQVSPRKKMVGLFKGELWVDAKSYLPVREEGRFVKNPSVFLKKIDFVRDYTIQDGVAYPSHIESTVDTRFWGPAKMSISFSNVVRGNDDQLTAIPAQVSQ